MNTDMLKGKIRERARTQESVAKSIGISVNRFNAKLNETDEAEGSLGEVNALVKVLCMWPEHRDQMFLVQI